ncbi:hypothetical protein L345_05669, partial [Ophiophagus hannah]
MRFLKRKFRIEASSSTAPDKVYRMRWFSTSGDVTTLVNTSNKGPSGKKKGRSKKAHVLAASVEQATQNFLEKGEQIAKESQDLKDEINGAIYEESLCTPSLFCMHFTNGPVGEFGMLLQARLGSESGSSWPHFAGLQRGMAVVCND